MMKQIFQKTLVITFSVSAVLGILFLGNYVVQAIQTGGAGHSNVEKDAGGRSIVGYDYTVCSSGCDYTSIYTAFNENSSTPSSYWISGNFTEANEPVIPSTSTLYFDDVIITLNGMSFSGTGGDTYASGKLMLTGTGSASYRSLFSLAGNNNDWGGCLIDIKPTGNGLISGSNNSIRTVLISGLYNKYKFLMKDVVYNTDNFMTMIRVSASNSQINATIDNCSNTGSNYTVGIFLSNADKNIIYASVDGVISGSALGQGIGGASSLYNTFSGVSQNCNDNFAVASPGDQNVASLIQ